MKPEVLKLAAELSARGEPYVLATVVWRRAVVGQGGRHRADHARPHGARMDRRRVRGADGRARGPEGDRRGHASIAVPRLARGARGAPPATGWSACRSPVRAKAPWRSTWNQCCPSPRSSRSDGPRRSPSPESDAGSAGGRSPIDDGGRIADHEAETVITTLDLARRRRRSFVVVATQGHYDEDALRARLATPAIYVGLVASAKRAGRGARLPAGPRGRRGPDRARARPRRARSRPRRDRRDRRGDPRRDRATAGRRRARLAGDAPPGASRGDRPGLRHDGRRRQRPVPHHPRRPHHLLLLRACLEAFEPDPARFQEIGS